MKNRGIYKLVPLLVLTALLTGGCFGGLPANIWRGFGLSLGGIPANLVAGFILDPLLGLPAV